MLSDINLSALRSAPPPEIAHLPSEQQAGILRDVSRRMLRDKVYRLAAIPFVLVSGVPLLVNLIGAPQFVRTAALLLFFATYVWFLLSFLPAARRRALHAELAERNIRPPHCVLCGYDLRGIESGVCPECGGRFASGQPTPAGDTQTG